MNAADKTICYRLGNAEYPGFIIEADFIANKNQVNTLLIDKTGITIPFEACVQKVLSGTMNGYFGATATILNQPVIININDIELVNVH